MTDRTAIAPHVLHIITGLDAGGAEGQLAALAMQRQDDGRPATVISLLDGGVHSERLAAHNVAVSSLGMQRGKVSLGALSALAGLIRRLQPAVIQSWMYHADLMATAALFLSGRWSATRLYWGVRCSDMDVTRYGAGLRRVIRLCARLSRLPDGIVVNSETGRDVHIGLGYAADRFVTIPNGIDTDRFRPDAAARSTVRSALGIDDQSLLLAHVARVDPMKDHDSLLAALDRLPGVAALAIGAGTEDLTPHPQLHRLGRRDDVPALLAASDILVCSSAFGEGFSNAIAEGMASGLPAVATEVGDAAAIVGACGRIVPPRAPDTLADAIVDIAQADRAALGAQARQRIIDHYSLDRMTTAFAELHGD